MDLRSQVFAPHRRRVPAGVKSLSQHQVGVPRQKYEPIKNGTTWAYHIYIYNQRPGKLVFKCAKQVDLVPGNMMNHQLGRGMAELVG